MISLRDSPIYRQKSFDESKHPRDEGGKFGEGGGSTTGPNKNSSHWTRELGQSVVDQLQKETGAQLKIVGSVAKKGKSEHDLDVMSEGHDKAAMDNALEKMGFEYEGQSLLSPKEAKAAKKEFAQGQWSELHHYKHRETGQNLELWQVDKPIPKPENNLPSQKSIVYRQKSKDASGHEHFATVSGKPANNLPK